MSSNRQNSSFQNSEKYWIDLGKEVSEQYQRFHSSKEHMSEEERLKGIHDFFVEKLESVWHKDSVAIQKYIEERKKTNEQLQIVQDTMLPEITQMFAPIKPLGQIIPIAGSSFTARTNLIGESDLDFNIPVPDMDQKKLLQMAVQCGKYGYKFADIRNVDSPGVNYVFSKWVEDEVLGKVEIEVKLNHAIPYMEVMDKVHKYLDTDPRLTDEHKNAITWIKHNFKELPKKFRNRNTTLNKRNNRNNNSNNKRNKETIYKDYYKKFKSLYYEHALFPIGLKKMMYPVI